ncbi:receptor-type tyrosine- phosphatase V-like, partial [Pelobates cultripes]
MALRKDCHSLISVSSFQLIFEQKQKSKAFHEEFEELKEVGNSHPKIEAELPVNALKNRYPHILPYDHSRVKLTLMNGDLNSGYINANYIAAPTPLSIHDFWRMIWEQKVKNIVMLTVCEEKGKYYCILCDQYWPSGSALYGPITVCCIKELPGKDWITRHFKLNHVIAKLSIAKTDLCNYVADSQVRHVSHLHYTRWPDRGIPESPAPLVNFVLMMRKMMEAAKYCGPTVLHCSAGVGRTGTLIALDVALQQMRAESCVDVFSTVYQMRLSRYLMVQTV